MERVLHPSSLIHTYGRIWDSRSPTVTRTIFNPIVMSSINPKLARFRRELLHSHLLCEALIGNDCIFREQFWWTLATPSQREEKLYYNLVASLKSSDIKLLFYTIDTLLYLQYEYNLGCKDLREMWNYCSQHFFVHTVLKGMVHFRSCVDLLLRVTSADISREVIEVMLPHQVSATQPLWLFDMYAARVNQRQTMAHVFPVMWTLYHSDYRGRQVLFPPFLSVVKFVGKKSLYFFPINVRKDEILHHLCFLMFNTERSEVLFYDPEGNDVKYEVYKPHVDYILSYINQVVDLGNNKPWKNIGVGNLGRLIHESHCVVSCIIMIHHIVFEGELPNSSRFIDKKHGFHMCALEALTDLSGRQLKMGICFTAWEWALCEGCQETVYGIRTRKMTRRRRDSATF